MPAVSTQMPEAGIVPAYFRSRKLTDWSLSGWTLLFCGQKSSQKSPRLPANPTVFECSEAAQKKLADRLVRAFGPCQLSWLKQFFAFPASEHSKTGIC
jgi:hypothetical protein